MTSYPCALCPGVGLHDCPGGYYESLHGGTIRALPGPLEPWEGMQPRRLYCRRLDCDVCQGHDGLPENTPAHAEETYANHGRDSVACDECSYTDTADADWCTHGRRKP